ncbi:Ig-like domain repeat protein, partial [Treponema primitia]|uniref:Ig-like domain repeat protein n=1 Tax=Treponema primitia TaxID=88058 RepID=UPI0018E15FDE
MMISFIKKSVVVALAVGILISCDNPIQTGLGNRVDITGPEVTVLDPEAGDYLNGLVNFNVFADDDIKVEGVFVYAAMEGNFQKESPQWIGISPPENGKIWTWQKNTTNEEDGILLARFRAVDNTGKASETEILSYTIKNLPPRIDLNIPNFSLIDRTQLLEEELAVANNGLSIDSGGVLIGYATDIQGVRYQSPKIKFWREGTPKPSYWSEVDVPVWGDIDPASSLASSKGREFRYYITDHQEIDDLDPSKYKDPRLANPMEVGDYRVQFQVTDTSKGEGISTIFPPSYNIEGIDYDYLKVHVVASYETPRLEVNFTPNNTYQGEAFLVEAKASHSMGIGEVDLLVRKSGETTLHTLAWEANAENLQDLDINGTATKSRTVESFFIIPGGYYIKTDGDTFLFDSGTYEFTVQAVSRAGARFSHTQTIYIDNTRPTVQITRVAPGVYVDPAEPNTYTKKYYDQDTPYFNVDNGLNIKEAYIVNGRVTINVAPFDQNGLGIHEVDAAGREIRRLRYLLARVNYDGNDLADPSSQSAKLASILPLRNGVLDRDVMYDPQLGVERAWVPYGNGAWMAGFMDKLLDSPDTGSTGISSPGADMITLNTNLAVPGNEGELYLFITAKDKANNLAALLKGTDTIGYHLRVNQGSDMPYVTFTDINDTVDTPAKLQGAYENIMESSVRIRGTLEDDDGILVSPESVQFRILKEGDPETNEKIIPFNAELYSGREGKSLSFNFSRQDLGQAGITGDAVLPDGVYRLMVYIADDATKKDGAPALSNEPLKQVWFALDAESPGVDIIGIQNNDFVSEELDMKVDVSDANGPLQLEVRPPQLMYEPTALQYWNLDYLRWISSGVPSAIWFNTPVIDPALHYNFGSYGAAKLAATGKTEADLISYITSYVLPGVPSIAAPVTTTADGKITTQYNFHVTGIDNSTSTPHLTVGLIAQDRFLKTTPKTLAVQLDKEKPHIDITNYSPNIRWFQGFGQISGRVWDPYNSLETTEAAATGHVRQIYYKKIAWTTPSAEPPAPGLPGLNSEEITSAGWFPATIDFPNETKAGWSVTIGETGEAEGIYTLYLYAVDQAGNRGPDSPLASQRYGLDMGDPTISITVGNVHTGGISTAIPDQFDPPPYRDDRYDLSGNIADTWGLHTFTITQSKVGVADSIDITSQLTAPLSTGALSLNWELLALPRDMTTGAVIPDLSSHNYDGTYTYTFTLIDMAGRTPAPTAIKQIVYIDTRPPEVTVSAPHSVDLANPGNGTRAFFTSENIDISGSATDKSPGTVTKIYYYDAPDTTPAPPATFDNWTQYGGTDINAWRINTAITNNPVEGNRRIWIVAVDQLGHRNASLDYTNSATDIGPATLSETYFPYSYDKDVPLLTETSIGAGGKWVGSEFTLDGTVGDSNALRSLKVTQTKGGTTSYDVTIDLINDPGAAANLKGLGYPGYSGSYPDFGASPFNSGANWSTGQKWNNGGTPLFNPLDKLPLTSSGAHVEDTDPNKSGSYHYVIVATDITGRTTTVERDVIVDITPPTVTIANALAHPLLKWFKGVAIINGSVWDPRSGAETEASASGVVNKLYYKITSPDAGGSYPADDTALATWSSAPMEFPNTAKSSWSISIPDTELEGKYSLYLFAVDQAGNRSPMVHQDYGIDKTSPVIEIKVDTDSTGSAATVSPIDRKAIFNLTGTITEATSGLQTFTITQRKDGGTPISITSAIASFTPGVTTPPAFSRELASLPRKPDGSIIDT